MLVVTYWRFSVSLKTSFLKIWLGSTLVKWCLQYIPYMSCIMCTGKIPSYLAKHTCAVMKLILKVLMGTVATGQLLWVLAYYILYNSCISYYILNTKFWWIDIRSSDIYLTNLLLKLLFLIRLLDLFSILHEYLSVFFQANLEVWSSLNSLQMFRHSAKSMHSKLMITSSHLFTWGRPQNVSVMSGHVPV